MVPGAGYMGTYCCRPLQDAGRNIYALALYDLEILKADRRLRSCRGNCIISLVCFALFRPECVHRPG